MLELNRQNFSFNKDWRFHNRHFQWYGALMEGRSSLALETQLRAAIALAENRVDEALALQAEPVLAATDADHSEPPTLAAGALLMQANMQMQAQRYVAARCQILAAGKHLL